MNRRRALPITLVAVAAVAVGAGYWFLPPQQVSLQVNYSPSVAGKTVAAFMDGETVGEFAVPVNQSCNMSVGCLKTLPDTWLPRGLHDIRVTMNGTTLLEQSFVVGGRSYAWVMVGSDSAQFGIRDTPVGWA